MVVILCIVWGIMIRKESIWAPVILATQEAEIRRIMVQSQDSI
jgi:hypothetical protein